MCTIAAMPAPMAPRRKTPASTEKIIISFLWLGLV
jgi:hypothetical protein